MQLFKKIKGYCLGSKVLNFIRTKVAKKKSEIAVKDHKKIPNPQPLTAITSATQ